MEITEIHCTSILTRTSGYLKDVCSHSLNPYIGCGFGNTSCGEGCYVRFNQWLNKGREWGRFVDVKVNADEVYINTAQTERRWATRFRVTRRVLEAMLEETPDQLILQTHSSGITEDMDRIISLSQRCDLRVHLSIEGDQDSLPGLPPPPCSVEERIRLVEELASQGITTGVCMSPLYPLNDPDVFFQRITESGASAVVIDHFIEGDGTQDGSRTQRTRLPQALARVDEQAVKLSYRENVAKIARNYLPVGISSSGFAGVYSAQVDAVSGGRQI